jgi:hypothetical protein
MMDLLALKRPLLRPGTLLSGTALCPIKPATPKRQIIVKGPVASIRIQKQPPQPYPIAKPEGARWVMTINPQTPTPAEPTAQTKPLIDDQPKDNAPNERQTKITTLIALLCREGGATIDEMAEATSWQPHSLRGALSGILKKKLGLDISSDKVEGRGRVYRAA